MIDSMSLVVWFFIVTSHLGDLLQLEKFDFPPLAPCLNPL